MKNHIAWSISSRLVAVCLSLLWAVGLSPAATAGYIINNSDFEKSPWLSGWRSVAGITPTAETAQAISGVSLRIPAHAPPVATAATSGAEQDLLDPGTGQPTTYSDFKVTFDFRLLSFGGSDRNLTFALKSGAANVIVLNVINGVMQAFDGSTWRSLHTTAQYRFNDPNAIYHLELTCSDLGGSSPKYNLSFADQNGVGLTFSNLTYLTNTRPSSILFNNAYTGHAFLVDNVTFALTSPTGYTAWVEAIDGLANPTRDGDPDGDGLKNVLEYIAGSNPAQPNAGPIAPPLFSAQNATFSFSRLRSALNDAAHVFQYSSDLENWTDVSLRSASPPAVVFGELQNGMEPISITVPVEPQEGRLFGRLMAGPAADGPISIHTAFEGGSARLISIDHATKTVKVSPGGDPRRGWPCWWYLRISGLTVGETYTFQLDATGMTEADGSKLMASWALPKRIAVSADGEVWRHSALGSTNNVGSWRIPAEAESMWLAWGPPFTPADSQALVDQAAQSPHAQAFELGKSNEGRSAPALRVTQDENFNDPTRKYIWVNARAHAWESGSSWTCKGFVDWLISDDPRAVTLRTQAIIIVVPILDIDNTFLGNGGKEGLPQDHNRDWSDNPFHAEVRAAQELITNMHGTGRFELFVELHNPGPADMEAIYYIPPATLLTTQASANMSTFRTASAAEITGPMPFTTSSVTVNSSYHPRWRYVSFNWVSALVAQSGAFGLCLEVPWNTPNSTTEGYGIVGKQVGLAIERYLRTK